MTPTVSRRGLIGTAAATAAAVLSCGGNALAGTAAAPRAITYTRRIGEIEITTLLDGYFLLEQAWVTALDPALLVEGLTAASLDPAAALPLPITGYLIRQPGHLTLIDAGAGTALGPTAGHLPATLAALGVAPDDITRLIFSHLHPDHIGGVLAGDAAVFRRATVHVSGTELAFWTDAANAAAVPDAIRPWFDLAGRVAAVYGDRVQPFDGDADLGGGLTAMAMPGHTPGHSGYLFSSGSETALLWADSTAVASLQFAHPDTGIIFDTDSALAARTRRRVLDLAVADRLLVSGTHMPFPGFGHVVKRDGAYAWVPEEWRMF